MPFLHYFAVYIVKSGTPNSTPRYKWTLVGVKVDSKKHNLKSTQILETFKVGQTGIHFYIVDIFVNM